MKRQWVKLAMDFNSWSVDLIVMELACLASMSEGHGMSFHGNQDERSR